MDAYPPPPELKWSGEDVKEKAVQLLKAAHVFLDWANRPCPKGEHELFALRGAGLVYAVLVTAADQPAEPWRPVHTYAFSVFERVLGKMGLELNRIGRRLEERLYDLAIKTARSDVPPSDPQETPQVQALFELLEKFTPFLKD